jgi:hypothetical protein
VSNPFSTDEFVTAYKELWDDARSSPKLIGGTDRQSPIFEVTVAFVAKQHKNLDAFDAKVKRQIRAAVNTALSDDVVVIQCDPTRFRVGDDGKQTFEPVTWKDKDGKEHTDPNAPLRIFRLFIGTKPRAGSR